MSASLSRYFDAVDVDERMKQMLSSRFVASFDRFATLWNESLPRRDPFHLPSDRQKVESLLQENKGKSVNIRLASLRVREVLLTACETSIPP